VGGTTTRHRHRAAGSEVAVRELPIFHQEPVTSLHAVMVFPNDLKKAAAYAAWKLARYLHPAGHKLPMNIVLEIARDAADFAPYYEEAKHNEFAGTAAGAVVKCLWAMICQDRKISSWEMAIRQAEDVGIGAEQNASRALFRRHLRDFRPVLHLLRAWEIRGRRFLLDNVAQGYDINIDARNLVQEAETLRQQIQKWEAERPQGGSLMAGDDSYQMTPAWMPPEPKPSWPRAGGIPDLRFGAGALVQTRGKPGRKKILSSEN
jgi:hypothetical protein